MALGAIVSLYFAMDGLSAMIVSVINVTQPLFVLGFEWIAHLFGVKIVSDRHWGRKLIAISFIVIGIGILYLAELV